MLTQTTSVLEYHLFSDAFLGHKKQLDDKLTYLARLATPEVWDYGTSIDKPILRNYLCYTYDRVKEEGKISIARDESGMCFNTGLLTVYDADIYAYFIKNTNPSRKPGQDWFLHGFKQKTDTEMRAFASFPDVADYFTTPADFVYDKNLNLVIDYDHIIADNYDRFNNIGLPSCENHVIHALMTAAVQKITDKLKRNYKLAIPQYFTDKYTGEAKIQLLLPLFLLNRQKADLVLVVDKDICGYVGKTILTPEWAYINSRRITRPDVDWLQISQQVCTNSAANEPEIPDWTMPIMPANDFKRVSR